MYVHVIVVHILFWCMYMYLLHDCGSRIHTPPPPPPPSLQRRVGTDEDSDSSSEDDEMEGEEMPFGDHDSDSDEESSHTQRLRYCKSVYSVTLIHVYISKHKRNFTEGRFEPMKLWYIAEALLSSQVLYQLCQSHAHVYCTCMVSGNGKGRKWRGKMGGRWEREGRGGGEKGGR